MCSAPPLIWAHNLVRYIQLCRDFIPWLFRSAEKEILDKEVPHLPVNQAGLALRNLNLYDLDNSTASMVVIRNLVDSLQGHIDFRLGVQAQTKNYRWEEIHIQKV